MPPQRSMRWLKRDMSRARSRGALGSSVEAATLRFMAVLVVIAFVAKSFTTAPRPGLSGRSALLLAVVLAFVLAVVAICAIFAVSGARARAQDAPKLGAQTAPERRAQGTQTMLIALLAVLTAASAALAALQPKGAWQLGPPLVACFAGVGLSREAALRTVALAALALLTAGAFESYDQTILPELIFGALPWFVIFRLLRNISDQHAALEASQASEARAAAAAERGRLAREMHDVLAHSLSALALQLEGTRLLARDRDVDEEVCKAIERAHRLTAGGLQEARRAIATARGDELPGPERIGVLASAFGQSGMPVEVQVSGQPRTLTPEAGLAVYRTAQEALTNVCRHATPQRVQVRLDYRPDGTVLVVEDSAGPGVATPPAVLASGGYGLTGMRERAELLGGELLAAPTAQGFRVELRLPA